MANLNARRDLKGRSVHDGTTSSVFSRMRYNSPWQTPRGGNSSAAPTTIHVSSEVQYSDDRVSIYGGNSGLDLKERIF